MIRADDGTTVYSNADALVALADAAAKVPRHQAIVEVGVYQGGSLRRIAKATRAHVTGVDTWGLEGAYASRSENPAKYGLDNQRRAEQHLADLDNVTLIRGFSVDVAASWDGPKVGMLYIDAEHTRRAVLADFDAWAPHLIDGATVCFDDYTGKAAHRDLMAGIDELVASGQVAPLGVYGGRLAVTRSLV